MINTYQMEKELVSDGGHVESEADGATVVSVETLAFMESDGISWGDSSLETLDDFAPSGEASPSSDNHTLDPEPGRRRERMLKLMEENTELKNRVKRRTAALDAMRKAYIVDVARLKKNLCDKAEQGEYYDVTEATLDGIPSLDFRPMLQLYAPSDAHLQMSPCGECGGTIEIVHLNHGLVKKLEAQISNLQRELEEQGQRLGTSQATAELLHLKETAMDVQLSQLKGAMVKEISALKTKLEGSGPEVVAKLREEREKVELRVRLANTRVNELEKVAEEANMAMTRFDEDEMKVNEMEHHLRESSREFKRMASERDKQAAAAHELRAKGAMMERDAVDLTQSLAEMRKTAQEQEETHCQTIKKLRALLAKAQINEAAVRDELAVLREERLEEYDDNRNDDNHNRDYNKYQVANRRVSSVSLTDKMQLLELRETLQCKDEELEKLRYEVEHLRHHMDKTADCQVVERELGITKKRTISTAANLKASAVIREDILSGAQSRREEQVQAEATELRYLLSEARRKAREADKDKRQLLEMLKLAKERPCDAERAVWNAQLRGWGSHKIDEYGPSHEDGCTGIHAQEELGEGAGSNTGELPVGKDDNLDAPDAKDGRSPGDFALQERLDSARGIDQQLICTADSADIKSELELDLKLETEANKYYTVEEDGGTPATKELQSLAADCRKLRAENFNGKTIQASYATFQSETRQLEEQIKTVESDLTEERRSKSEMERSLEERKELLSKATLTIAEGSMALHDATADAEQAKAELRLAKEKLDRLESEINERSALNIVLEAGITATKVALGASGEAARKVAALAERRAHWAESEGLRAEEEFSRRILAQEANAKQIASLTSDLSAAQTELVRRRREAKEHAEEMKGFRAVVEQRERLEVEISRQHERLEEVEKQASTDVAIIEELKLQIVLMQSMRREVLVLEDKVDMKQKELAVTQSSLKIMRDKNEAIEHALRESKRKVRNLWGALTGLLLLVDDWCSGPLLAWRNIETVDNDMVNSPNHRKGLVVPFEARGVDEVMRTWNGSPKRANGKESSQMSNVLSATGDSSNELSTEAQLEKMRPKDVISWVEFRVYQVATADHNARVQESCAEKLALDATCKQRGAQLSNMEEAIRQVKLSLKALEEEHARVLAAKEALDELTLKQNEALLDNHTELQRYVALKVEYEAEVLQHGRVSRRLETKENEARSLIAKLYVETSARAAAEAATEKAEHVRASAVKKRKAAEREMDIHRAKMERVNEMKTKAESKLNALIEAENVRLATTKAVATEVAYGDFTAEGPTQTAFVCPELTLRQVKRRASRQALPPEVVGPVYPALRGLGRRDHLKSLLDTDGESMWFDTRLAGWGGTKWKAGIGRRRREDVDTPAWSVPEFYGVTSAPTVSWKFAPLPEGKWESGNRGGQLEGLLMAQQEPHM